MTPHDLMAAFEAVAEAPDGVARLRELVLELAVRGRLVPQQADDEPASLLLGRIRRARREAWVAAEMAKAKHTRATRSEVSAKYEEPQARDESGNRIELPRSWCLTCVEALTDPVRTVSYGILMPGPDTPEGVPYVTVRDIRNGQIQVSQVKRTTTEINARFRRSQLEGGDVLVTIRGTVGKVALVPTTLAGGNVTQDTARLAFIEAATVSYMLLLLRSPLVQGYFERHSKGAAVQGLNIGDLRPAPIPLPPLAEQHRIVARVEELIVLLDRLDGARTTRDATRAAVRDSVLDALREAESPDEVEVAWTRFAERIDDLLCDPADIAPLRRTVLQLAVRGRLVRQDPADEPASDSVRSARRAAGRTPSEVSAEPAVDERFPTPCGWTWAHIGDVAELRLGKMLDKAKNSGRPQPYLRNTNVHWFRFELGSVKEMRVEDAELAELRVRPGDLLICEGGHGIARSAVWGGELDDVIFQKALHRVRPLACLDSHFLSYCLRTQEASGFLQRHYTGAGIPHFTGRALAKVVIPLPPRTEQRRIVARVQELMGLLDRLEARLTAAQTTHAAFAAAAVHHLDNV